MRLLSGIITAVGLAIVFTLIVVAQQAGDPVIHKLDTEPIDDPFLVYLPALYAPPNVCENPPTLLGPANGSHLDNIIPLFRWNSGSDPQATRLRLLLAKDPAFNDFVSSLWSGQTEGEGHFRFSRNLDPHTTYYWRAWLECAEIESPYSEAWSFTTGSGGTILPAPALVAPADGTKLSSLPAAFQWSGVNGAVEYIMHWREIGRNGYTYNWTDQTNAEIRWLSQPDTIHEWWVSARNNYAIGHDSPYWKFKSPEGGYPTQLSRKRSEGYLNIEQYGEEFIYTYDEQE